MPKKSLGPRPTQRTEAVVLGNVRVGHNGITLVNPEEADQAPLPPTVNLDDLIKLKELGAGASGSVLLYRHKGTGERFAVKKMAIKNAMDVKNAAAEIRAVFMARVSTAVKLYNAFFRDGYLLLIMEYMDGGNLEELLDKRPRLDEAPAAFIVASLLNALAALHAKQHVVDQTTAKRQIHRDLKPANVMLSSDGRIKLADFGVAGSADSIGCATFVGTAAYMSPERIKGESHTTSSDIWSLGVVTSQLLLGRFPLNATAFMPLLKEVNALQRLDLGPDASPAAQAFVDRCVRQNPAERGSAESLLEDPWIVEHVEEGKDKLVLLLADIAEKKAPRTASAPASAPAPAPAAPAKVPAPDDSAAK